MQNVVVKHNHAGIPQEGVIDVFMIWTVTNVVEVDIVCPFSPSLIEVSIVVDTEVFNDLGTAWPIVIINEKVNLSIPSKVRKQFLTVVRDA